LNRLDASASWFNQGFKRETTMSSTRPRQPAPKPLKDVRIFSLCLNLPGPAALQRCRAMGATCIKLEPPPPVPQAPGDSVTGDPMSAYSATGYQVMHRGIRVLQANLKLASGQQAMRRQLAKADILLTSFRPSALTRLGLDWPTLHQRYPKLSMVAIFGDQGALAEEPGHDLTYVAQAGLVTGLDLPATLYADMAGSLLATEAILQALLLQRQTGQGWRHEVALADAAAHLALPRSWGSMDADSLLGGSHAGYRIYPCLDGRVALAALEPHFARSLCRVAGIEWTGFEMMRAANTQQQLARFIAALSRRQLDALSAQHDIPLCTMH
jgi:alpha-methylacyl-CoA racemase